VQDDVGLPVRSGDPDARDLSVFEDPGIGNVVTVLDEPVLERKAVLLLREGKTGCIRADILQRLLPREEKKAVFLRGPFGIRKPGCPPMA
jgi:hypothetical protein